jgi:hypothetical protein
MYIVYYCGLRSRLTSIFGLFVSDLAPVDVLIQRAGRLAANGLGKAETSHYTARLCGTSRKCTAIADLVPYWARGRRLMRCTRVSSYRGYTGLDGSLLGKGPLTRCRPFDHHGPRRYH